MKKFIIVSLSSFSLLAFLGCQQPAAPTQPVAKETTNATVNIGPSEDRSETTTASLQIGPAEGETMETTAELKANLTINGTSTAENQ